MKIKSITKIEPKIYTGTWQSLVKLPRSWFDKFGVVICDEAHHAKSTSIKKIMENMVNTPYRFGFTGSLDGTETNEMVIEGLFGPTKSFVTTIELIKKGIVSDFKINAILFQYSDEYRKLLYKVDYDKEIDFIVGFEPRNKFIRNLAVSLKGNTLLLFRYIDKHGKILYDMLKDADRKVFFVTGKMEGEERNEIRKIIDKESDAIVIASEGTSKEGINIPNLHNIILASPSKSRVNIKQMIGRVIRKHESKTEATVFDLVDDLKWKKRNNITLNHFKDRLKIYINEEFKYKIYPVRL